MSITTGAPVDWEQTLSATVAFAQRLIQTPSMPGEEAPIARIVQHEMQRLGYDDATIDAKGNVIGRVYGRTRGLPALVLNAHLDHVDPGDPALWQSPPYAAVVQDGYLIGRGASDIKGPLATQVHAVGALLAAGRRPQRDVLVTAVVQEEIGGPGAMFWAARVREPLGLIVLGEPSSNTLALGHRGIRQLWLTLHGRSAHASAPHKAINPNYALATVLARLEAHQHTLGSHPRLGPTTVAPTIVEVDTRSRNVTPAWARVCLDFRTAVETGRSLLAFIDSLAAGFEYSVKNAIQSGPEAQLADDERVITGYDTVPDDPAVERAAALLGDGLGAAPAFGRYEFATDGRHFTHLGVPIIGFAPGDEHEAHTANEKIALGAIAQALRAQVALLDQF